MNRHILVCLALLANTCFGLTLEELKKHLPANSWQAGETPISRMHQEDRLQRVNTSLFVDPSLVFIEPQPAHIKPMRVTLPAKFDWSDVGGVNYSSPILDQGQCESCTVFGSLGAFETQMNVTRKTPTSPWRYSAQHMLSCGGGGCKVPMFVTSVLGTLMRNGVPDAACFPYLGRMGADALCSDTCSDYRQRSDYLLRYNAVSSTAIGSERIKQALLRGPVLTTMKVFEDFFYYRTGVYKHVTGKEVAGHTVSIEGWDDATRSWRIKNSWGTWWGDKGYFNVAWDDTSGIGSEAYSLEVGAGKGVVTARGLASGDVVTGKHTFNLYSSYSDTRQIRYQIFQGPLEITNGSVAAGLPVEWDTTTVPDGTYELRLTAERASGTTASLPLKFNVLNGKLEGTIDWVDIKDGDTVTGTKVLEAVVNIKPFLPSSIQFIHRDTAGKTVQRATPNVHDRMRISWNTTGLAKGTHTIYWNAEVGWRFFRSPILKIEVR